MKTFLLVSTLSFGILVWTAAPLPAQVLYGSLVGNVTDSSQALLPGAELTLSNSQIGQRYRTTSDEHGFYSFRNLAGGDYTLEASANGFGPLELKNVRIAINTVNRADVVMQLGTINESISVSAAASALQTVTADVHSEIGTTALSDLPLPGYRNYQSLLDMVPGATPSALQNTLIGTPGRALGTNINGASRSTNTTKVDGVPNVDGWLPSHTLYVPPAESIEVVNISTASFDAEQGMAGGAAVNVVTKSGTNQFHGVGFEYHSNSALSARNFFFLQPVVPKNIQNQYGGTFGGPVKKDRVFFFASYEGMRQRQSFSATPTVATAAQRAGDFNGTGTLVYDPMTGLPDGRNRTVFPGNRIPADRLDPIALKMQALVPLPNFPGTSNNYFVSSPLVFDRDNYDMKGNWNPTSKLALWSRYGAMTAVVVSAPTLGEAGGNGLGGGAAGNSDDLIQVAGLGGTYTVSPRLIIDGNAGYNRKSLNQFITNYGKNLGLDLLGIPGTNGPDVRQSGYPSFVITGYETLGTADASKPAFYTDNSFSYNLNAAWMKGSHNIRFGGSIDRRHLNHWQPQIAGGPRGQFSFGGGTTSQNGGAAPTQFNSYAAFLLGLPQTVSKSLQYESPMTTREWADGIYARDQWQVNRKLSLSLGLRWEFYPMSTRDHGGLERYDLATNTVRLGGLGATSKNADVSPSYRLFAPRVGAAYRITPRTVLRAGYGITIDPTPMGIALMLIYPEIIGQTLTSASSFLPYAPLQNGIPPFTPVDLSQGVIPIPGTVATSTVPPGRFNRGHITSYNFAIQRELPGKLVLDMAYVGTRQVQPAATYEMNAGIVPGAGAAGQPLNVQFKRTASTTIFQPSPMGNSSYNSLQVKLDRRFAQGLMVTASYTWSKSIDWSTDAGGLLFNMPSAQARNRAVSNFDRTQNFWASSVWELPVGRGKRWLSKTRVQPVVSGWQINVIFSAYTGLPFTVAASGASLNAPFNTQVADQITAGVNFPKNIGAGAFYFDPSAFKAVTEPRFGNTGRNAMRGPGQVNLDVGLFRSFQVRERVKVQFRAEAFNSTNTPHFNNPGATFGSGGFGSVTSAKSDQRFLRLALRLSF
jgi:outer membrane receptor protein involved in Fe transport